MISQRLLYVFLMALPGVAAEQVSVFSTEVHRDCEVEDPARYRQGIKKVESDK